ncbi:NAD(P)-dependent oxidoreductase [Streptomyces sp. NPDC001339]|uniref:NAD(P)-dependent oxidoreductase n=1 Tax=Streptomyces sp. NPDC001339 TaxID=3364563 RepID=UPI0036764337
MPKTRVLRHRGVADGLSLPTDLHERVELVDIPPDTPPRAGLSGDVLYISGWRATGPALYETVERSHVRWIHTYGTGMERLDLHRLTRDGRIVTNSSGADGFAIAEWVLASLLAFEKRFPEAWSWETPRKPAEPRCVGTLQGRRVGLLGLGSIGSSVAALLACVGASVRALRRTAAPAPLPNVEMAGSLGELVRDADHLVLTAPLTPATAGMIDDSAFHLMRRGVHVVNVARGGLIDHDALRRALAQGIVARASLDVVSPERLPLGHWLRAHPRVRLTPHVSFRCPGSDRAHAALFLEHLRAYLRGEPLANRVDPDAGY